MFNINFCRWLDMNCRPLELEATTLPTEPQPLPTQRGFYTPNFLIKNRKEYDLKKLAIFLSSIFCSISLFNEKFKRQSINGVLRIWTSGRRRGRQKWIHRAIAAPLTAGIGSRAFFSVRDRSKRPKIGIFGHNCLVSSHKRWKNSCPWLFDRLVKRTLRYSQCLVGSDVI